MTAEMRRHVNAQGFDLVNVANLGTCTVLAFIKALQLSGALFGFLPPADFLADAPGSCSNHQSGDASGAKCSIDDDCCVRSLLIESLRHALTDGYLTVDDFVGQFRPTRPRAGDSGVARQLRLEWCLFMYHLHRQDTSHADVKEAIELLGQDTADLFFAKNLVCDISTNVGDWLPPDKEVTADVQECVRDIRAICSAWVRLPSSAVDCFGLGDTSVSLPLPIPFLPYCFFQTPRRLHQVYGSMVSLLPWRLAICVAVRWRSST